MLSVSAAISAREREVDEPLWHISSVTLSDGCRCSVDAPVALICSRAAIAPRNVVGSCSRSRLGVTPTTDYATTSAVTMSEVDARSVPKLPHFSCAISLAEPEEGVFHFNLTRREISSPHVLASNGLVKTDLCLVGSWGIMALDPRAVIPDDGP
jgi:hypothetical protein